MYRTKIYNSCNAYNKNYIHIHYFVNSFGLITCTFNINIHITCKQSIGLLT